MTKEGKLVASSKTMLKRLEEERIEQDRLDDILLLLEHLFEREEVTARIILDCLYDIGAVNLINKKVPFESLRGLLKSIAKASKPAFRVIALKWFKKNCPKLITDWLHSLVTF